MSNLDEIGLAVPRRTLVDLPPPHLWFIVSAIFHYLGPSFAVLLFPHVGVLGVAWFRIGSAALIFAPLTRPWRIFAAADRRMRLTLLAMGVCLAVMNTSFYLALDRLPMSLVAAMEFVATISLALAGTRSLRNLAALILTVLYFSLMVPVGDIWPNTGMGFLLCSIPFVALTGLLFMHDRTPLKAIPVIIIAVLGPLLVWWLFSDVFYLTLP